jgi:hypothetical protein
MPLMATAARVVGLLGTLPRGLHLRSESPECWNPDITSDASWVALQQIVNTINGFVALINGIGAP